MEIKEITHMAVAQLYGLVLVDSTVSDAFADRDSAIAWARDLVDEAHGEADIHVFSQVIPHERILDDGSTHRWTKELITVRTSGGPTWVLITQV